MAENSMYHTHISSKHRLLELNLKEVWQYRDLIYLFTKRNFVVSYKQTILGPAWIFLTPLFTSIVQAFVFGGIAGIGTDGIPTFLFYLCSNAVWSYFATCLVHNANTFTANAYVFGKVYFPRLTTPISNVISTVIRFGIQMALVLVFMYNIAPRHLMLLAILLLAATVVEDAARGIVWLPVLAVVLHGLEKGRLRSLLLLAVCAQLALSSGMMLRDAKSAEPHAQERGADMMEAADYLTENGYTHGYGTFWNVRVMQERTQGALTFTGVAPVETEEGAVSSVSLDPIRWLEPDDYSDLDICPERTFLLLTRAEEEQLAPWLDGRAEDSRKRYVCDIRIRFLDGDLRRHAAGQDEAGKRGFCGRHIHDFAGRAHARADFVAGEGHVYAAGELRGRRRHGADVCDARF